jgi:hypothetical protein
MKLIAAGFSREQSVRISLDGVNGWEPKSLKLTRQNHYCGGKRFSFGMATRKQSAAARRNIKKAAAAAKRKRTVAHLPKRVRTALGKEGAKAARRKRRRS